MSADKFERMMAIIDEVFATRQDPEQLQVSEEDIAKLQRLHPATLSQYDDDGPAVWILLIPTTKALMEDFLAGKITEQALLDRTPENEPYDALYLCSASVLPEYRGRGLAVKMTLDAIEAIRRDHPIAVLFVWPFTAEGKKLAGKIASITGLELREKQA